MTIPLASFKTILQGGLESPRMCLRWGSSWSSLALKNRGLITLRQTCSYGTRIQRRSAKGDAVEPEVEDKPKKARKSGTKGKAETSKAAESPVKKPDAKEETKDSEDDPVKSLGDTGKDAVRLACAISPEHLRPVCWPPGYVF